MSDESVPLVTISLDTPIGGWQTDPETGETYGRGSTIADALVDQAATRLVKDVRAEVVKVAVAKVDHEITMQVRKVVAAVLAEPFRVTGEYGNPSQLTTIRERIAERVTEELKPNRDHYSSKKSVITELLENEVRSALTRDLRTAVEDAKNKLVDAVRAQAADVFAEAMKRGLR